MRGVVFFIILSSTAFAGNRAARRAIEAAQEVVADSDADCSRKLGRKLDALEDGTPSRREVRAVIEFAADECPKKLAAKVRRALAPLNEDEEEEEDVERPKRRVERRRDCGTGDDPGCGFNPAPMDAMAFRGLLDALRANGNEYTRLDVLRNTVVNQRITAAQLGPILDSFQNEFLKLDAAKAAVPRLVNPQHAFGHASRFRNTFIAADFTRLLSTR
ncbi:MAG: hypothetical protein ACO1OB_17840 [Archangium sp.]